MRDRRMHESTKALLGVLAIVGQWGCGDPNGHSPFAANGSEPAATAVLEPTADSDAGAADGQDMAASGQSTGTTPNAAKPAAAGSSASAPVAQAGAAGKAAQPIKRATTTSYQRDIRPVLDSACVSCHVAGGSAPFALDSWDAVHTHAGAVVASVAAGTMPPWPADDSCHALRDSPVLSEETRDLFTKWGDESFPEGNSLDYLPPLRAASTTLTEPSLTLDAGATYTPKANADDYRCFVMNYVFDKDTYLSALDIVPDQRAEIHQIEVHRITPEQRVQLLALDLLGAGTGYSCGLDLGLTQNMFGWRPGGSMIRFEQGDGAYIQAGSSLMIQVHYNTQFLPSGTEPTPDQSKLRIWTLPEGQLPERVVYRQPILLPTGTIPVDDAYKVVQATLPFSSLATVSPTGQYVPGEVIGITPAANRIATRMGASIIPESGVGEQCLLNVPDWQFGWQLDYLYRDAVPYAPNDSVHAICVYDNSAEHQPVFNGAKQASQRVTFGDGAQQEQCLHYLWLRMDRRAFLGEVPAGSVGEVPVTPAPQGSL